MRGEILIVDDESDICDLVSGILEDEGYETRVAMTSEAAEAALHERLPSLVVLDVWLKGSETDGLDLLGYIKRLGGDDLPVIMISGHGTLELAVSATKMGAQDFLQKPFKSAELLHCIERALAEVALRRENSELRLSGDDLVPPLIMESQAGLELAECIRRVTPLASRLFIWGETGVGKATVARMIHQASERSAGRFIIFNCLSVSVGDFETELLGLESDGQVFKIGALENAHNGSLLLEDIDKMPLEFQGRFAKILQRGEFTRVGGGHPVSIDVRVMVTSLFAPQELYEQEILLSELYHRLHVEEVFVPPLRSRGSDIESLFYRFVRLRSAALRCSEPSIDEKAVTLLQSYDWPGNLRQMRNIVARLLGEGRGRLEITASQVEACLQAEQLYDRARGQDSEDGAHRGLTDLLQDDLRGARHSFETEYLRFHLRRFDGNIAKTAQFVGMDRASLHRKLKSLRLL